MPADAATDRPILGVVAGGRGLLLVDTGNSTAHARLLLHEIAGKKLPSPTFAMLTHWHWDHVFGASALPVPTFAHRETVRIVTKMAQLDWSDEALDQRVAEGAEIAFCRDMIKKELPDRTRLSLRPPDIAFSTEVELDLGGVTCQIAHVGGDHSPDSSIVYVPGDRVLFLGDCIYEDIYHGPPRYTTRELFPLLDRLLAYDTAYYLAAHHEEPLSWQDLVAEAGLLKTIGRLVDSYPPDREALLGHLPEALGAPLTDDHLEILSAFLAGKQLPDVESVL
jgi:glyoxylase-like metal-dependent hydrolase (beta-lactamase superfamily II)